MTRKMFATNRAARITGLVLVLAAAVLVCRQAEARSVYLNGVKIDGLTNQVFKGATVRIDSTGNVHIEAKGYTIKAVGSASATGPTTGPPVSETYWMVATETNPGKVQWDVEVFINGKFLKKVTWDGGQVVADISRYLYKGNNLVHFRARRNLSRRRISYSAGDKLRIVLGAGVKQAGSVVITRSLATFTRTAADTEPLDRDLHFKAR